MKGKFENLIGKTFNRLTVIDMIRNNKNIILWVCECSCESGKLVYVPTTKLKTGYTKSCGCFQKEIVKEIGLNNKKYNIYDLSGEYGIGYTSKGEEFYFDLEDYDKIKDYSWYINNNGYAVTRLVYNEKIIFLHNFIMNSVPKRYDHENRIRIDNRKCNLRCMTLSQNNANSNKRRNNNSGITGVHYSKDKKKWISTIRFNNNMQVIGAFIDKTDAIIARLISEKEIFKEFAPQKHLFEEYGII